MSDPAPQNGVDLSHVRAELLANALGFAVPIERYQVRGILLDPSRHLFDGEYMVHKAGRDRTPQDRVVFRGFQALRQGHAAVFFDCPEAQGAISAGARQHNADGILTAVIRKGAEESIDGGTYATC